MSAIKFQTQEEFLAYANDLEAKTERLKKVWQPHERVTKNRMKAFFQWNINRARLIHVHIYSVDPMPGSNKYSTSSAIGYL